MQYQEPTSLQKKEAQKRSNQFKAGDLVIIASRFFSNHSIPYRDLGVAVVREVNEPCEDQPPSVKISVKFDPVLIQCAINGYIKISGAYGLNEKRQPVTQIEIHPVYLENVKTKRKRKGIHG